MRKVGLRKGALTWPYPFQGQQCSPSGLRLHVGCMTTRMCVQVERAAQAARRAQEEADAVREYRRHLGFKV